MTVQVYYISCLRLPFTTAVLKLSVVFGVLFLNNYSCHCNELHLILVLLDEHYGLVSIDEKTVGKRLEVNELEVFNHISSEIIPFAKCL